MYKIIIQKYLYNHLGFVWVCPALFTILIVILYPMIFGLYLCFVDYKSIGKEEIIYVGFENFQAVLIDDIFINSITITFFYVTVSVSISFIFGFGLALILQQIKRGISIFHLIFIAPMAIAPPVVALLWKWIYNPLFGLLNPILMFYGFPQQAPLASPDTALIAVLIADIWQWTSLVFLIMYAGISGLPKQPYEAAQIDGAGKIFIFYKITLPLLTPIIFVALVLRTVDAFRTFDLVNVMTAGGPALSTELLSLYVYRVAFKFFQLTQGVAAGHLMLIGVGTILGISFKYSYKEL